MSEAKARGSTDENVTHGLEVELGQGRRVLDAPFQPGPQSITLTDRVPVHNIRVKREDPTDVLFVRQVT